MSLGATALGDAALGSTAGTEQTATATASLAASDGDRSTATGTRGVAAATTAADADRATTVGTLGVAGVVTAADAGAGALAGVRTRLATPTGADADRGAFGGVRNPTTQTVTRTLNWRAVYQRALTWTERQARTLDIDTMSDIQPHDHYLAGESETWEFDIQKDGSDYDVSSATVAWYLLPLGSSDPADAVLSDGDSGVTLAVSDADSDGTSERVTLEIDQGVTDGLDGYYTQLLEIDDSGPGLVKFAGDFPIEDI